ncbi:MAG: phosphoribosylamine--glycine ligase, partial [Rhodospirillales bacterium]|nr:phosphoribosylamine--glycine ligase [Rhodospirillales bacterium]
KPTVEGMVAEGRPFKGVLFAGLMITETGPRLIEYNVRFGDPECQAMMMRLKSDVLEALLACAEGRLDEISLEWHDDAALVVVMATDGYPGHYDSGSIIRNIDKAENVKNAMVFHAGTKRVNGNMTANGGRVLGIAALAPNVSKAKDKAYQAVKKIDWPEGFYRSDIGWRAIDR